MQKAWESDESTADAKFKRSRVRRWLWLRDSILISLPCYTPDKILLEVVIEALTLVWVCDIQCSSLLMSVTT